MSRRSILICALLLACSRSEKPTETPHVETPRMVTMSGLEAPARTAKRVYGLYLFEAKDSVTGSAEKSIALEIRKYDAGTPQDLDAFWEREGAGVELAGGKRVQLQPLDSLGDWALWHPIEGGLRLFAYGKKDRILVLTLRGVPTERALPWARELAATAVRKDS